jgi:hypothetical protein
LLETIKETHGHYGGAGYSDTRSEDIAVLIPHLPRGIHRCERFDVMMATLNSSGDF